MRLINVYTGKLESHLDSDIPKYAILSHTWETAEVTFQDQQDGLASTKAGYAKIEKCMERAREDQVHYIWVDTCCIDKSSSAELSEAINSMFNFYQKAQICYAYLSGVDVTQKADITSQMKKSRWFSRGWTLQELLAPANLVFYDKNWTIIGSRAEMEALLTSITGIDGITTWKESSIAQKMSWASKRETTRDEDLAYCLLGLFEVNMAPLYGEGMRGAFLRLQLEIIAKSDDESIFAWQDRDDISGGLLAASPAAFANSSNISTSYFEVNEELGDREPFCMTNKGLRMDIFVLVDPSDNDEILAPLRCTRELSINGNPLAIVLRKAQGREYARIYPERLTPLDSQQSERLKESHEEQATHEKQPTHTLFKKKTFYVKQRDASDAPFRGPYQFHIQADDSFSCEQQLHSYMSKYCLISKPNPESMNFSISRLSSIGMVAGVSFTQRGDRSCVVIIDVFEHRVGVAIFSPGHFGKWITLKDFVWNYNYLTPSNDRARNNRVALTLAVMDGDRRVSVDMTKASPQKEDYMICFSVE